MKIAILGAGNIGRALGHKWTRAGHEVAFGARDPNSPKTLAALTVCAGRAEAMPVGEAIAFGEVVLFAIPNTAVEAVLAAHAEALNRKIVIDATNRFGSPEVSHVSAFLDKAPQARLFRAFNSLGWEVFDRPDFGGETPDLFYCGPDDDTRPRIEQLIDDAGLRPIRVGGLDQSPVVDAVGTLWLSLAVRQARGRHLAFKMLAD